ncbi:AI-2E family transporter [Streptomyces fildesensis]|uniref:AI-2E family transporter n=1 Tax=Streptomyces fildesensis TaxID=375757 RepID=A0ABW8CA70_9ACTN
MSSTIGPAEEPVGIPADVVRAGPASLSVRGMRRRSWFVAGFTFTLGAFLAWQVAQAVLRASQLLLLVLLAFLIAVSLEPLVGWLVGRGIRRGRAVLIVIAGFFVLVAGLLAVVIPPVVTEVNALVHAVPGWLQQLHDHHSTLGRLEDRYHLTDKAKTQIGSGGSSVFGGLLGAGLYVVSAITATVVVVTLTVYFMVSMPAIKRFAYQLVPGSRRARTQEISEEILVRIGRFMLGNVVTSAIAGVATFAWCAPMGVPYAAALGIFTALMDMIPMVGSTIAGVVVSLVALSVSWPVAAATAGFYIAFRLLEDYLIMTRAMRFAVDVHPVVTVVAVLAGGALLGIIGALVAVPVAVAINLVLDEVAFPELDAA